MSTTLSHSYWWVWVCSSEGGALQGRPQGREGLGGWVGPRLQLIEELAWGSSHCQLSSDGDSAVWRSAGLSLCDAPLV